MAENENTMCHESLVEQCYECPLTIDGELSYCPVAFLHLYHRGELPQEATKVLFEDGKCQTKIAIEKNAI